MRLIDFKSYVDPVSAGAIIGAAGISAGGQVASGLFKPSLKRQWKYQHKQPEYAGNHTWQRGLHTCCKPPD